MGKSETINRDVGEQSKGPKLQRLRAVQLLLDVFERDENATAFCAVEFEGDVYLKEATESGSREYHEEDKNYEADANFTLASHEVINTLVIFADCWIGKLCRSDVYFGFYAPNGYAKERNSERTRRLGIEWPTKAMIELLSSLDFTDDRTLNCLKLMVLDEYRKQYPEDPTTNGHSNRGNLGILEAWGDEQWKALCSQITWKLGEEDDLALESTLKLNIQRSKLYTQGVSGKEDHIIALMCALLDKRQSLSEPGMRFINASDLQLQFLKVASGSYKLPDPSWKTWEQLAKPEDTRNLADKVVAVCPTASRTQLGRWSRKASNSLNAQKEFDDDISLRSLKYHVFDVCEEKLEELRLANPSAEMTPEQLLSWVTVLVGCCEERLKECSKHYAYTISGQTFLADMIWELIDSCYLAFDASAA